MKGFTPTGHGMRKGFHFPRGLGFTGSTGDITMVSGYKRQKYANGGPVRREGRMTVTKLGDAGNAAILRKRASNNVDQRYGGKTPLRPGYKEGGWIAGATKNKGALHRALGVPEGQKIPAKKMAKAAKSDSPLMRKRVALAKTLKSFHKADGGSVNKQKTEKGPRKPRPGLTGALQDAADAISSTFGGRGGRERKAKIDREVDKASGYADGGAARSKMTESERRVARSRMEATAKTMQPVTQRDVKYGPAPKRSERAEYMTRLQRQAGGAVNSRGRGNQYRTGGDVNGRGRGNQFRSGGKAYC